MPQGHWLQGPAANELGLTDAPDQSDGDFLFFVGGGMRVIKRLGIKGCLAWGEWLKHVFPLLIPRR